jgi:hypothetical protein
LAVINRRAPAIRAERSAGAIAANFSAGGRFALS